MLTLSTVTPVIVIALLVCTITACVGLCKYVFLQSRDRIHRGNTYIEDPLSTQDISLNM